MSIKQMEVMKKKHAMKLSSLYYLFEKEKKIWIF